ncbi:zinc finger CCCH domain-containing protein 13-like [Palaemon carinicauda]|uniref:zinc finger CCCH domain-containing protein 13-like n=1 Tax=Palaemon carinicauda TaxID=392227 RepID=UPI0035B62A22
MFGSSSEDDFPKRGWSQTSRPLKRKFDQRSSRTSQAGCSHWKDDKESSPERFSSEGSSPSKRSARALEDSPAVEQLSEIGMTSLHAPSPPSDWISPAVPSKRSEVERTPNRSAVHALSSDSDRPAESVFKRSARRALEHPPIERSTERERPPRRDVERDVRRPPGRDVKRSHIERSSEHKRPPIEHSAERERPPERDARRPHIERSSERKCPPIERSVDCERPPGRDVERSSIERSSGRERALVSNIERPLVCDVEPKTSRHDIDHNTTLLNSDRVDCERSEERQDFLSEEEAGVPLSPSEPLRSYPKMRTLNLLVIR